MSQNVTDSIGSAQVKPPLRLFVWDGVLADWSAGIAFALAYSLKEAKAMLIKDGVGEHHWDGYKLDGVKPSVYRSRVSRHVYGGG